MIAVDTVGSESVTERKIDQIGPARELSQAKLLDALILQSLFRALGRSFSK
jgi:hypothetical protein